MGVIKFLDAHGGTILTICIIVVIAAIITYFRLKKMRWEFEIERQKLEDKYGKPTPIVKLERVADNELERTYEMCREMIKILRHLEYNEDWQMENGFCFFYVKRC